MTMDPNEKTKVSVNVDMDLGEAAGGPQGGPTVEEAMSEVPGDDKKAIVALKEPEKGRVVYKTFVAELKAAKKDDFTAEIVISNGDIDRDRERVDPKGIYIATPKRVPLVAGHSYGDLRKQIGDVPKIKRGDNEVTAIARWLVGQGNSEADWGWNLATQGLAAFSIGFLPEEWTNADIGDEKVLEKVRAGKLPIREYTKSELVEVSQVIVPSNRAAIQRLEAEGVLSKALATAALERAKDVDMSEAVTKAFEAALVAWKERASATVVEDVQKKGDHDDDECPDGEHMVDGECVEDKAADPDVDKLLDAVDEKNEGDPESEVESDIWAAIESALLGGDKDMKDKQASFRVGGARGLPIIEVDWDAGAARASMGDDLTQANVRARWKAAHIVYDSSEPENKGSYKLPFAKVVGGRLKAVRRGLQAARAVLAGGRGGVDLPGNVKDSADRFVNSYLGKPEQDSAEVRFHAAIDEVVEEVRGIGETLKEGVAEKIKEQVDTALKEAGLTSHIPEGSTAFLTAKEFAAQLFAHVDTLVDLKIAKAQGNVDAFRESNKK